MGEESYCREIEAYLCRKNDGHLIRVVGPAFEMVSRWASDGVPLKVAFSGIDRAFERYYRKGPRRRPVRVEFCEADVLDVFDEWRRALGLSREFVGRAPQTSDDSAAAGVPPDDVAAPRRRTASVPSHLQRVLLMLTNARATGRLSAAADPLLDRIAAESTQVQQAGHAVRGSARQALTERLAALDRELLSIARGMLDESERAALERDAAEELRPFRDRMSEDVYQRTLANAVDRLIRDRFRLPTLDLA